MANNLEFTFDITPNEGTGDTYRVVCRSRVLVKWEQQFRGASLANLERPSVTDLTAIAFMGAVDAGRYEGNLNNFRETNEVDLKSDLDIFAETAVAEENERRRGLGEGDMTPLEARKFEKRFRKENEDLDSDDDQDSRSVFGPGPTR